ncbi:hypothetical protein SlsnVgp132 [Spodoptera littoralis nucleopolyhedrovirus]|uniref:Uncharacterized protein n=1 Tax=Spodoptera littoralis nuclear polyhedrosis virus TaxID=10456 RepID=M1JSQ1_NPVSL|nr:hypothetical protein SlsnVgp132 [Spodoptera littoralis nucleopolyhedrovirus]AGE89987.1 hypothetical protein SlsnVgp132 [Spodoptera littoralis nucleopolyhedrovirus]AYU75319.1 hypothetical protein [Spodoptera littoralis nucleopolyhedrovirus]
MFENVLWSDDPFFSHTWPIVRRLCRHHCKDCTICGHLELRALELNLARKCQQKLRRNIRLVYKNVFTSYVKSDQTVVKQLFGNIKVGRKVNDSWMMVHRVKRKLVNRVCREIFNPELMTFKIACPNVVKFDSFGSTRVFDTRVLGLFGSMHFKVPDVTKKCVMCFDPVTKILFFVVKSLYIDEDGQFEHFRRYLELYNLTDTIDYTDYSYKLSDMIIHKYDYNNFNSDHFKYPPINCYFTANWFQRSWSCMMNDDEECRKNWFDVFMFRPMFNFRDKITPSEIKLVTDFVQSLG